MVNHITAGRQLWLVIGLVTGLASVTAHAKDYRDCNHADPIERTQCVQETLTYTPKQIAKVASVICSRIDRYKRSSEKAFEIKPEMCVAVPGMCDDGKKYLDIRGIVRATITQGLKITDNNKFEGQLTAILSEVMTHNCSIKSSFAITNVPFHNQKRNITKRAVFTGQIASMFNRFLFSDYEFERNGRKAVSWDINAVEIVDGEPETLLDYLDKILAPAHNTYIGYEQRGNARDLRREIIDRGAVNARRLDCAPIQRNWCKVIPEDQDWLARESKRLACREACFAEARQLTPPDNLKTGTAIGSAKTPEEAKSMWRNRKGRNCVNESCPAFVTH
tara:strand:- start:586 stop:1587 length:1002 start_codon:yes stop_codon:yes gene_type:complete